MSEFEDFIKAKYPVDYESLKEKYPNVPVVEFYGDELDVWNHQQSKITQLKAQLIDQGQRFNDQSQKVRDLEFKCEGLEKRIKNGLSNVFKCRVIGADRIHTCNVVEEALRGGHE